MKTLSRNLPALPKVIAPWWAGFHHIKGGHPCLPDPRSSQPWPLEPIAVTDELPFCIVKGYCLAGVPYNIFGSWTHKYKGSGYYIE